MVSCKETAKLQLCTDSQKSLILQLLFLQLQGRLCYLTGRSDGLAALQLRISKQAMLSGAYLQEHRNRKALVICASLESLQCLLAQLVTFR